MLNTRRTRLTKAILAVVLLASLALSGCYGPRGWPATQSEGDTLYACTMDGRVVALDPNSGMWKWDWQPAAGQTGEQTAASFSCASTASSFVGGFFYGAPAVSDGLLYVAYRNGKVYAVDAASGVQEWSYDLRSAVAGGLAVNNDTVFVGSSNGKLSALDAGNGSLKWEFSSENEVWATPQVIDDTVYFGSLDHSIYALNASDGTKRWAFKTGGGIASTPVVVDGVVYIGSFDKKFYAIDADTGTQKWVFQGAGNWFWSNAVYDNGTIYAGSLDYNVYALDAGNGTLAWPQPFKASDQVRSSPVIAGGVLVVASEDGKIYGLYPKTGEKKWEFDGVGTKVLSNLCAAGGTVYINSQNNKLYALDGETGQEVWAVRLSK